MVITQFIPVLPTIRLPQELVMISYQILVGIIRFLLVAVMMS